MYVYVQLYVHSCMVVALTPILVAPAADSWRVLILNADHSALWSDAIG